ncbi:RNA 2'-phosphotransferase [Candidatus Gracilibacteria bacterium]|nr:RNA 2'-phosphotransferase [Candidatus Gracilibacteria bacterium]
MDKDLTRYSKFISLVLRHEPEKFGVQLDAHGWVAIDDVIAAANRAGLPLTRAALDTIVAENSKQRFAISADGTQIRARQGHSVAVDLQLPALQPPAVLYHGTATRFLDAIKNEGLRPGARQHVHLSLDEATARSVGQRHGKPAILLIDAAAMHRDGLHFYCSENGVWLTDVVPVRYISSQKGEITDCRAQFSALRSVLAARGAIPQCA